MRCVQNVTPRGAQGVQAITRIPEILARLLVRAYRYTLSPLIGFHCRHLPTCSDYAEQSLGRFGFWAGGWMTLARLCRCQPWGTSGLDFIPERAAPDASWYRPWRYGRWRGTNPDIPAAGAAGEPAPSSQA